MGGFSIFTSVPHPQSGRKTVGGVSEATKAIVIGTLESLVTSEGEEGGLRIIVSSLATIVNCYNMEMGPIEKKWVWHNTHCTSSNGVQSSCPHYCSLFHQSFNFFFISCIYLNFFFVSYLEHEPRCAV